MGHVSQHGVGPAHTFHGDDTVGIGEHRLPDIEGAERLAQSGAARNRGTMQRTWLHPAQNTHGRQQMPGDLVRTVHVEALQLEKAHNTPQYTIIAAARQLQHRADAAEEARSRS